MAKTEGTYITNLWPFFMIQRPTIREQCAWVKSNTWQDERPVATGLDWFLSIFQFFNKCRNWQPKKFRICATATGGPVFCSWVQFDFGLFSSPANWTCKHYQWVLASHVLQSHNRTVAWDRELRCNLDVSSTTSSQYGTHKLTPSYWDFTEVMFYVI